MAVASDANGRRLATIHLTGGDPYSFTGPMLAWAAGKAAAEGVRPAGAPGPVEGFGDLESACVDAGFIARARIEVGQLMTEPTISGYPREFSYALESNPRHGLDRPAHEAPHMPVRSRTRISVYDVPHAHAATPRKLIVEELDKPFEGSGRLPPTFEHQPPVYLAAVRMLRRTRGSSPGVRFGPPIGIGRRTPPRS